MLPQNEQLMPPWRASMSVLHAFAIGSTIFRLSQRYTSQRLWYDDYTALFAVIADCIYFAMLQVWTRSEPNGTAFGRETTITFYWIGVVCFLLVSWSAKVSLALAIARIFPPGRTIRRFATGMAWSFGLLAVVNLLGAGISCGRDTSWHNSPQVQCDLPKVLVIPSLCANLISDALLILTPLRMLWRIKLPDEQRRLILAGFAASVWVSIAAGVCFVFLFGPDSLGRSRRTINFLLGHAMASVSLMVCNSMVVVTFVYRLVRSDKDLERSVSEAVSNNDASNDISPLTTIILTDPGISDDGFGRDSHRRGTYSGYSFSERYRASSSLPALFVKSRTTPYTNRSV
ncbi:hypothetical protein BD779DRAFT_1649423 [Infundibulicybe gibba]|nr:hypothetical protein BD779DRAFT_1649423 [Infundibulicybe gibba]